MTMPVEEAQRLTVGIGEVAVTSDPASILVAYGLGSCVALAAFDPAIRVAGMVHVLLPNSEGRNPLLEPGRYADSGVDVLLEQLRAAGAMSARLVLKAAGGASVLGAANTERFKIGERNADAIKERLRHHGLRLAAEDLGGERGRTMELHLATGRTYVRTAASTPNEL